MDYQLPNDKHINHDDLQQWASSRETDVVVALAIHQLSGNSRSPDRIWELPTNAEWDSVIMAVQELVDNGYFDPQEVYFWGEETFTF